ncbi:uncharacterized protein LOC133510740 isoform X2 [Syngnathoides biaculeatus]|uniref:uncharacterized protein LOC133510740 isoform X2 n=1 Tax=Syngnathoides biaculeatus TaxID=300417 RepID=UPI002ADD9CDD|nr:uncharacterized protein LOC133510740 isoform X2 [Syngnathoides biaculeatus]
MVNNWLPYLAHSSEDPYSNPGLTGSLRGFFSRCCSFFPYPIPCSLGDRWWAEPSETHLEGIDCSLWCFKASSGRKQMAQHLPNGDCPSVTSADDVAGNMATTSMSNDTPSTLLPVSLITLAVVVQSSGSFGCPSRACLTSFRKAAQHSPFYIYF